MNERLVLEAANDVKMAKIQRDLYNQKKKEAQEHPDRVRTCTIDYAQNTLMPHFGDKQPSETCCYSPINVYALVSGPVVRHTDETRARCFTNGYLRIQHDLRQCNGIGMISSRSLNKSSLFRYFILYVV